jgi:hypothetical protein
MREKDRPFVSDPVVEADLPFGGFCREVRCFIAYANSHFDLRLGGGPERPGAAIARFRS